MATKTFGEPPVVAAGDGDVEMEWTLTGTEYSLVNSMILSIDGARELGARLIAAANKAAEIAASEVSL